MSTFVTSTFAEEVTTGERFEFGWNWSRFLDTLTPDRIAQSERALEDMLGPNRLAGRTFLDVGSGSGLSSLAAHRLGARVTSIDFDPYSVACTAELRQRYATDATTWRVLEGSALDPDFLMRLGRFDLVYSWGVLHHTGAMWRAFANVERSVAAHGMLFLAIYNDQGTASRRWTRVKRIYNRLPTFLRPLLVGACGVHLWWRRVAKGALRGRPFAEVRQYGRERGMSFWTDLVDWVGGYPFEVAKPEAVFDYFRQCGFRLERLKTNGGSLGCNEYVFVRTSESSLLPGGPFPRSVDGRRAS